MALNPVQFLREAYTELRKATWLSKKEMAGSTVVVLVLVALTATFVASVDFVLTILLGGLLGR